MVGSIAIGILRVGILLELVICHVAAEKLKVGIAVKLTPKYYLPILVLVGRSFLNNAGAKYDFSYLLTD